jgi:photosystem II stability/assembly factor-like uncharacterized protein
MKNTLFLLKITALIALFSACKKDAIQVQWTQNVVKSDYDWRAIQFFDAKNGVIVGGKTWSGGFALRTKDGGTTWQSDSVQQWCLYGLNGDSKPQNTEGSPFYTVGISGQIFEQKKKDSAFVKVAHPYWRWFRDVAVRGGRGVSVGGQGWGSGVLAVFQLGSSQPPRVDTFPQELESVAFADDSVVVAVGYGLILRSANGGASWSPLKKWDSDFYTSICFPSEKIGYIVGFAGEILKTTDGGASWSALQSANNRSPKRFNSVFFTDILRGVICGSDGVLWRTSDGGGSWQVVDNLPNVNFYDIFVSNVIAGNNATEGWLVGSGGTIVKFAF